MSKRSLRGKFFIYLSLPIVCFFTGLLIPVVFTWKLIVTSWEVADQMIDKYTG